jgi:hypothetical protein
MKKAGRRRFELRALMATKPLNMTLRNPFHVTDLKMLRAPPFVCNSNYKRLYFRTDNGQQKQKLAS